MALNIPMPESSGESLLKGLKTGSDLIHQMMLNKYYGQLHPSGDVANAIYVENLRQKFGEDDPRYISAKRAHDLMMQGRESLIGYRDVLNQTAGVRATSPTGKLIAERKGQGAQDILRNKQRGGNVRQGTGTDYGMSFDDNGNNIVGSPADTGNAVNGNQTGNTGITPDEREVYDRVLNKASSDEDARKRMRFAENLDITRKSIIPKDLLQYSGPHGTLKWIGENVKSFRGNPSEEFKAYNNAVSAASLMVKQMRQFYGESIQAPAMAKLEELANPSTWYKDPKIAEAQFNQLNKILDAETATYKKYGTLPIQSNGLEFKNGQFELGKNKKNETEANTPEPEPEGNEGGSRNFKASVSQLMKINPNWTEKNIRETAKIRKTTIDNVINQLFQKSARGQ